MCYVHGSLPLEPFPVARATQIQLLLIALAAWNGSKGGGAVYMVQETLEKHSVGHLLGTLLEQRGLVSSELEGGGGQKWAAVHAPLLAS